MLKFNLKQRKSILFISQYFPPDITAAAFRISETAAVLNRMGFDVSVLTARPHRMQVNGRDDQPFFKQGIIVVRAPILRLRNGGSLGYILHYLSFMITSIIWGILETNRAFDYVVASSPPLFVGISGKLLSKWKRAKFVLDIRDLWPDSAVATGLLSARGTMYRWAKKAELFLYKKAELIICVSVKMKDIIAKHVKLPVKVEVIYNGVDIDYATTIRVQMKSVESERGSTLADEFVISYVGNLGHAQGLEVIIENAKQFIKTPVKFRLVGDGPQRVRLQRLVAIEDLKNIIFTGPCSKEEDFNYMINSSALLIHLRDDPVFAKSIPSKLFDYLWAQRPILYGIRGEGKEILDSLPGNIYFEPGNAKSLARTISILLKEYELYLEKAKVNRDILLERFTRQRTTEQLAQFLLTSVKALS